MVHSLNPGRDKGFLSSPEHSYQLWWPPSLLFNRYWDYFPGVKWQGPDVDS
jgi:hypothetical protein